MQSIQDIHDRLARIEEKIDVLNEHRVTTIVTTRYVSLVVSGLCGLLTMAVTSLISYYIQLKTK